MNREEILNKIRDLEKDIQRLDIEQNAYCISLAGVVNSKTMKKLISYSAKKELRRLEISKLERLLKEGGAE